MIYAKIIDGGIRTAPRTLTIGEQTVANPTPAMLEEAGYLPVVTAEPPQTDENSYPVSVWTEDSGRIVQSWRVEQAENPEKPLEERIAELESENALLHQQATALSSQNDFQEELIVELANIVYT